MNTKVKRLILEYYWAMVLVIVIGGVVVSEQMADWRVFAGSVGTSFSLVYFAQKQQLEELRLFKELFDSFNSRYNEMNEPLNHICDKPSSEPLSGKETDQLYDYFNLCGEEYLYYRKGYIYPEVWEAWSAGMSSFYENDRVGKLWREELSSKSYYGLSISELSRNSA